MNAKELNFAYKVRHALNENLDSLPASTVEKLASARKLAVSRRKSESRLRVLVPRAFLAGATGKVSDERSHWLGRMGLIAPLIILVVGLTAIYQVEQQRRISETADLDAMVLSDELPLSAYLDHGFNAYLAKPAD